MCSHAPFYPDKNVLDNCLYTAVKMFYNNDFALFEMKFHCSFDENLGNVQFYALSLLFFLKGWPH